MIKTNTIAQRYAQAIINIARRSNSIDAVGGQLNALNMLYAGDKKLAAFLNHPRISLQIKYDALVKITEYSAGDIALKFMRLLITKERIKYLPEICGSYQFLQDLFNGIIRAKIITAFPFDDKIAHNFRERLKLIMAKEVILNMETNRELLGGIKIQIGDTVFDGSIRGRLNLLREQLSASLKN
jgi:F-type H+-transporting ATPase subunit delta